MEKVGQGFSDGLTFGGTWHAQKNLTTFSVQQRVSHKFLYLFTDFLKCRDQGFTWTYHFLLTLKTWQVTGFFSLLFMPLQISTQIYSYVWFNESKVILLRCLLRAVTVFTGLAW